MVRSNLRRQRPAAARVRSELDEQQTANLRSDLRTAVDTAMTRPHPHLPHNGPIGRITRPGPNRRGQAVGGLGRGPTGASLGAGRVEPPRRMTGPTG